MKKSKQTGFTLIELLVVVSIISLLSSMIIATVKTSSDSARYLRIEQDMKGLANAAALYYSDYGVYPTGTSSVLGYQNPGEVYTASLTFPAALGSYVNLQNLYPPCANWQYTIVNSGSDPNTAGVVLRSIRKGSFIATLKTYYNISGYAQVDSFGTTKPQITNWPSNQKITCSE